MGAGAQALCKSLVSFYCLNKNNHILCYILWIEAISSPDNYKTKGYMHCDNVH